MSDELKPCPFCGGKSSTWTTDAYSLDSAENVLGCNSCDIYTPFSSGFGSDKPDQEYIAAWNARAEADALRAEVERLRGERVKPLSLPERRNSYWGHKDGYQVAHTNGDLFRVRFHGKVICKNIKGFERAVAWANSHHAERVLSALAPAGDA